MRTEFFMSSPGHQALDDSGKSQLQIPRSSSPRKRGYGRLGMTRINKGLAARLKPSPFKARYELDFFRGLLKHRQPPIVTHLVTVTVLILPVLDCEYEW